MDIDIISDTGNVCFRIHIKRQQAQSINIPKHPSRPTSINTNMRERERGRERERESYLTVVSDCFIKGHFFRS